MKVSLDGQLLGELATSVLDQPLKHWHGLLKLPPDEPLRFAPGGAVGLSVQGSTVLCRSFRVTPLPEQE
jgi:hypothetical protein